MIIAVAGYIGTGKSTVCELFKEFGAEVVNVDVLGHELLNSDEIRQKLLNKHGPAIISRDLKTIDRKKLAEIVLNDHVKIKELNKMVHPFLKAKLHNLIHELKGKQGLYFIDVALFQELDLSELVDKVIIVRAELETIYDRLKNKYTQRQIINAMNLQKQNYKYDFEIINNGTLAELRKKVIDIYGQLNKGV